MVNRSASGSIEEPCGSCCGSRQLWALSPHFSCQLSGLSQSSMRSRHIYVSVQRRVIQKKCRAPLWWNNRGHNFQRRINLLKLPQKSANIAAASEARSDPSLRRCGCMYKTRCTYRQMTINHITNFPCASICVSHLLTEPSLLSRLLQ